MKYHPHMSARSLTTTSDPLRTYPAQWELMKWYTCWRKVPYQSEIHAAILAEERNGAYSHYPCPMDASHWHIGRGGGQNPYKQRIQQAKRVFRKAVRDEIWREHEERVVQRQEEARSDD